MGSRVLASRSGPSVQCKPLLGPRVINIVARQANFAKNSLYLKLIDLYTDYFIVKEVAIDVVVLLGKFQV